MSQGWWISSYIIIAVMLSLNVVPWSLAEANGVATTASDGSFEALIFQVNRDGGGSCTCEYDTVSDESNILPRVSFVESGCHIQTGTAKSWNRCKTLVNPPGIQGMWQSDRTNHTAKFQMPR
jgi:hypothetical protein